MLKWFILLVLISGAAHPAEVPKAPRALAIIGCQVEEFVTILLPDGSQKRIALDDYKTGEIVSPSVSNYRDYEWKIRDGELACQRDLVDLMDTEELKGAPSLDTDFSSNQTCVGAAIAYTPIWNDAHEGWAVFAAGCPNPQYSDNGTPDDKSDDRIVGHKMPECPSEINGMAIKCNFDESEV